VNIASFDAYIGAWLADYAGKVGRKINFEHSPIFTARFG
jgi:hypothetical protein